MRQRSLFDADATAKARQWIIDNPAAWHLFCRFTRDVIDAGHSHYSSDAILHRMRWHTDIETRDPDVWKVNNNLTPYLAREFERVHPECRGFFRKRVLRDERTTA